MPQSGDNVHKNVHNFAKVVCGTDFERKTPMLKGTFHHNIDVKGRVIIPAKLREGLGDSFVASKDSDGCIKIYSTAQWAAKGEELSSMRGQVAKSLQRKIFSEAEDCELDAQGRTLIPAPLREHADIKKEVVIIGVNTHVEIWDKDRWSEFSNQEIFDSEEMARIMEDLGL